MTQKLKRVKEFLTFSRSERNGIVILLVIIIILLFAPIFYKTFVSSMPSDNQDFYSKVDSFFGALQKIPDEIHYEQVNPIETEEIADEQTRLPFFFDPNTASVEELVNLGLSLKQANVVLKYRSKGGVFHTPSDFAKIYSIDSTTFKRLKPWIRISKRVKMVTSLKKDSILVPEKLPIVVELNTADTNDLVKIRGIGKVFARRIIAYRNLLGGYASIRQLNEVYGVTPELIRSISSNITIDTTRIKLINLNLISYEDLKKHPYLSEYHAKAIIYYRSKVGNINKVKELLENKILIPEKYRNIRVYLSTY